MMMKTLTTKGALRSGGCSLGIRSFVYEEQSVRGALRGLQCHSASGYLALGHIPSSNAACSIYVVIGVPLMSETMDVVKNTHRQISSCKTKRSYWFYH